MSKTDTEEYRVEALKLISEIGLSGTAKKIGGFAVYIGQLEADRVN